jgi:hypothetical protein
MNKKVYTENKLFSKMVFVMNALEKGWKVKKIRNKDNKYIFYKKIDDTKEAKSESFLELFVNDNTSAENLFTYSRL